MEGGARPAPREAPPGRRRHAPHSFLPYLLPSGNPGPSPQLHLCSPRSGEDGGRGRPGAGTAPSSCQRFSEPRGAVEAPPEFLEAGAPSKRGSLCTSNYLSAIKSVFPLLPGCCCFSTPGREGSLPQESRERGGQSWPGWLGGRALGGSKAEPSPRSPALTDVSPGPLGEARPRWREEAWGGKGWEKVPRGRRALWRSQKGESKE